MAIASTQALLKDRWIPQMRTRDELCAMPVGTLGRGYGEHLRRWDLEPDFFPDIDVSREDEFVRARLYQTHDILHTLTGYDASEPGEAGIVGFMIAQYLVHHDTGGHMAGGFMTLLASSLMLHAATVENDELRPYWDNLVEGYERGRASRCLIGPRWEEMLHRPLAEVRAEYRIPPRPQTYAQAAHG
jgi:ubiquinone biosynthesis protein Coq4